MIDWVVARGSAAETFTMHGYRGFAEPGKE